MPKQAIRLFVAGATLAMVPLAHGGIIARYDAKTLGAADGSSVTSWASSNGGPTITAAGAEAPTYQAAGLNGQPTVEFNGTSNVLKTATDLVNARTVVAVTNVDAGAPNLAGLISNGADKLNVRVTNTTRYRSEGNSGDNNEFYRFDGVVAGSDGLYVNNVVSGPYAVGTPHVVASLSESANTFADFWIGNAQGTGAAAARWWKGDVSEVIVFDHALSADERAGVARNLSLKWNFASPLSATPAEIAAADALGVTVPEPASAGVLGVAVGFLACRRKRRA